MSDLMHRIDARTWIYGVIQSRPQRLANKHHRRVFLSESHRA